MPLVIPREQALLAVPTVAPQQPVSSAADLLQGPVAVEGAASDLRVVMRSQNFWSARL